MKTELEKCLAGELFNGGDKVLADMTLNAKRLLKQLNETDYADTEQRKRIFHDLFGKMGEHVHIDIDFHCEYGKHIFIGDQVIILIELAGMYFPGCSTPKNAVRSLQRSIKRCTNLATALVETGYQPYNHRWLSPKQYGLIIANLGDPFPE